jgi:hypothetical protein
MHRARAHPFAIGWAELQTEVDLSVQRGSFQLSENSLFLLDHLVRLREVRSMPGIERILQNIEDANSYHSALFEVFILTLLIKKGIDVQIVEESKIPNERTPDFKVTTESGAVYVECKSLDDKSRFEERVWTQIEGRIIKILAKTKRYWLVSLKAHRIIGGSDIEPVLNCVRKRCDAGETDSCSTPDGAIDIAFQPISGAGWQYGTFDPPRKHERGWWEADQQYFCGIPFYRHPVIVESEAFFDANEAGRIDTLIQSGYGQIQYDHPGIIVVQVPNRRGEQLLEICDGAFHRIFGTLKRRPRVNAVVLCARTIQKPITEHPISEYFAIIPNGHSEKALPEEFEVPGARQMQFPTKSGKIETVELELLGEEGTLMCEFGLHQTMSEQRGRDIIYYCNRSGTNQIRAWQSYNDEFRVDIVMAKHGRQTFKSKVVDFEPDVTHKLCIAWSKDKITIAADGRMLTPCDELEMEQTSVEDASPPAFEWYDRSDA